MLLTVGLSGTFTSTYLKIKEHLVVCTTYKEMAVSTPSLRLWLVFISGHVTLLRPVQWHGGFLIVHPSDQ